MFFNLAREETRTNNASNQDRINMNSTWYAYQCPPYLDFYVTWHKKPSVSFDVSLGMYSIVYKYQGDIGM